jgi:hypothetical protein
MPATTRKDFLVAEYEQIADSFRTLTEIRFQLLGLLSLAAGAASVVKPETGTPWLLPFALLGLAFTLSIVTYNKRNDQLYDELVGRAAAIERELGVPDGAFGNRPAAWLSFGVWKLRWPVNHRAPVAGIYIATISFWLFLAADTAAVIYTHTAAGAPVLAWWSRWIGDDYAAQGRMLAHLAVAFCAIVVVVCGTLFLKVLEALHRNRIKDAVSEAYRHLSGVTSETLGEWAKQIQHALGSNQPRRSLRRVLHCNQALSDFVDQCARARAPFGSRMSAARRICRQIRFYGQLPAEELSRYGILGSALRREFLISLLTDLPSRWIYDVVAGRR